ncbi:MAG: hypothetical protein JXQ82_07415 [Methanomicrobiaceae archaeon]|nr:hypothetical protein [Methanomicrobiaceae archaeon]
MRDINSRKKLKGRKVRKEDTCPLEIVHDKIRGKIKDRYSPAAEIPRQGIPIPIRG